jgi:hypothetical protein
MSSTAFSVNNILDKKPGDPKLEDVYVLDRQLGGAAEQALPFACACPAAAAAAAWLLTFASH